MIFGSILKFTRNLLRWFRMYLFITLTKRPRCGLWFISEKLAFNIRSKNDVLNVLPSVQDNISYILFPVVPLKSCLHWIPTNLSAITKIDMVILGRHNSYNLINFDRKIVQREFSRCVKIGNYEQVRDELSDKFSIPNYTLYGSKGIVQEDLVYGRRLYVQHYDNRIRDYIVSRILSLESHNGMSVNPVLSTRLGILFEELYKYFSDIDLEIALAICELGNAPYLASHGDLNHTNLFITDYGINLIDLEPGRVAYRPDWYDLLYFISRSNVSKWGWLEDIEITKIVSKFYLTSQENDHLVSRLSVLLLGFYELPWIKYPFRIQKIDVKSDAIFICKSYRLRRELIRSETCIKI